MKCLQIICDDLIWYKTENSYSICTHDVKVQNQPKKKKGKENTHPNTYTCISKLAE